MWVERWGGARYESSSSGWDVQSLNCLLDMEWSRAAGSWVMSVQLGEKTELEQKPGVAGMKGHEIRYGCCSVVWFLFGKARNSYVLQENCYKQMDRLHLPKPP